MNDAFDPDPDVIREAFTRIPRERWATILAMIFVQQMPAAALEQIVLRGRRGFIKWGRKTDVVGLKAEDYSDIFCNPPEAPILMADGTVKALGDILPGERVMGWSHIGRQKAQYVKSTVRAVARRAAQLVEVTFESGRVIRCTPDHRWRANQGAHKEYLRKGRAKSGKQSGPFTGWVTARIGRQICHVVDVEALPERYAREAGWLAGIYDGEGCCSTNATIIISQYRDRNPLVHAEIGRVLIALGFPCRVGPKGYRLTGGRPTLVRFLNWIRPARSQAIINALYAHSSISFIRDKIINVQPIGYGEVISMETETGNYIAWGFASRNCYIQVAVQKYHQMRVAMDVARNN